MLAGDVPLLFEQYSCVSAKEKKENNYINCLFVTSVFFQGSPPGGLSQGQLHSCIAESMEISEKEPIVIIQNDCITFD